MSNQIVPLLPEPRPSIGWLALGSLLTLLTFANMARSAPSHPNFVIIFCDDMGYGDVGCFGSTKHRTPHIDRMAREGMRLTSFYSTSGVCTPSRSSLMTGCYPRRVNMHNDGRGGWVLFPSGIKGLNPKEITVAEILKAAGYATAIVGKWHLGDQPEFLPTRQGFDRYFGIPYSNDMGTWNTRRNYPPLPLMRNEKVIGKDPDQSLLTQQYTREAIEFIHQHREKPFFLYLPHTMPHNPVAASSQFKGKSANNLYGDAIEEIDWSTGQILKTLKDLNLDEKTLVLFTSDNGAASRWGGSNLPLSGFKGSTMEGGMRVPCIVRWPESIPAGSESAEVLSTLDVLPTFSALGNGQVPSDRIIDGRNIWSILSGKADAKSHHEAFYYYFREQLQAVRAGPWKLHLPRKVKAKGVVGQRPARLFQLVADVAEKRDLSKQHPEIVQRLTSLAERARVDLGDQGTPGKNQRPAGHVANPKPLTQR